MTKSPEYKEMTPVLKFSNQSIEINQPVFRMGRSPDGDLVLPEPSISRKHAQIVSSNGEYLLEDLNSRTGTRLNGSLVLKASLKNDDQIRLGPFTLVYNIQNTTSSKETATDVLSHALKREFHQELFNKIDLKKITLETPGDESLRVKTRIVLEEIIQKNRKKLSEKIPIELFLEELLDEILGLGPIEPFLKDPEISEVMVNGSKQIYIEKEGKLILTGKRFMGDEQVRTAIERIVHPLGRRIDESSPMVDARLKDGSRVNAIIPPLSLNGPVLTIRKFPSRQLKIGDLIGLNSLNKNMANFLEFCVANRMNIIVSGGTGSGKTTLLNVLSDFIDPDERIITIEDAAELRLSQPHVISLETRPANMEEKGLVTIRDLVRNALRMRPNRIVIGECRGGEAFDMLSAMNTGHDGSLSTIHANSPRDALSRLENLVLMAGMDLPSRAIRQQITSAIQVIIQQSRLSDGSRKITHIVELTGMESDTFVLQEIFRFNRTSIDEKGKIEGHFEPSGLIPGFCDRLRKEGHPAPKEWFEK
ncbi:MAG: Flp pilus assembly complex ATPase component TadA [Nitrospirae bacterium]|nr:Flp pilus assembly complex ATPase component TadA [Nitrospirota bacterium]